MKYLKYLLLIVLGIILIYLVLCALGPKNLDVSENIEIKASAPIIYHLSNSPAEMNKWSEWVKSDTTINTTYNDIEHGVGAKSSWTSEVSGNGTQEVLEVVPYEKVRTELIFEGWDGANYSEINISETGGNSTVSWTFEGDALPFLMRGFALVTGMKGLMETNYEKGLNSLKILAEDRANGIYDGYEISESEIEEKHFIMHRQEVKAEIIQQFYASHLGALFAKVQQAGATMAGMPCGLFFNWTEDKKVADMAAAIPVSEDLSIDGTTSFSIPAQNAVVLDFYGDYSTIGKGLNAIERYMHDRSYLQDPPMVEEYVTDPTTETDSNKWLTKITYYFTEAK